MCFSSFRSLPKLLLAGLLVATLGLAGCFETTYSLGSKDQATVDGAYCGDWNVLDKDHPSDAPSVRLIIRNIDNQKYFVEWIEVGKNGEPDKSQRMIGFTADVKGATFAHLRDLPEDGSIPDKHLVMRVSLKDGVLSLQNLNKDFFEQHPIASDEEFRRIVEENLEDAGLYNPHVVTATRAAGK